MFLISGGADGRSDLAPAVRVPVGGWTVRPGGAGESAAEAVLGPGPVSVSGLRLPVVSRIEADNTRSAQSRARAISEQYVASLDDLAGSGDLTARVQKQLKEQTRLALVHLGQMTAEFGDQLDEVARAYRAPESRALAARVLVFSAISLVVFLVLIALGVGPMGVLLVLLVVIAIAALKVYVDHEDGA